MKVALVHDWLTGMRGGEKVLEVLCELYPEATIFTLVHVAGSVSAAIERLPIKTSFVQRFPLAARKYRSYLPFFPAAVERFDLRGYDLIISSSHCVAKGAIPPPGALHVCYCHTPMRYVWTMYEEYFGAGTRSGLRRWLMPHVASYLRMWDAGSCGRVDAFAANSEHVRKRIERHYGRSAEVIHPPVETADTYLCREDQGYYLVVSAFAPYKRVDLAVEAFKRSGRKLVIVGSGQQEKKLRKMRSANIDFVGWVGREALKKYYAHCRALIFPGEEDFGIVPLEAQCFGKPVIAYGSGGVLETVIGAAAGAQTGSEAGARRGDESGARRGNREGARLGDESGARRGNRADLAPTGVFFDRQIPEALMVAVERFESMSFDHASIREHALAFDREVFKRRIATFIENELSQR